MIVRRTKDYEQHVQFPNENFNPELTDVAFIVDETTEEGKALAAKIKDLTPFYDFVTNEAGKLIDVVDTKIQAFADMTRAAIDQVVTVTATLPANTTDTEVIFKVDDGPEIVEPVTNSQAEHSFAFSQPGVYTITVRSQNHGSASVEVTVA